MKLFQDREDAGRQLARALRGYEGMAGLVVLGLPRGGVPVAAEVAKALGAELGLIIVRKIGAPNQPELAIGAVASGGVVIRNEEIIRLLGLPADVLEEATARARAELAAKERLYGAEAAAVPIAGRPVILVDDGAATGATMRAAVTAARARAAARIIVALPTAATDAAARLAREADEVVCIETPEPYLAVGHWYADFAQVRDEEVRRLLERARGGAAAGG